MELQQREPMPGVMSPTPPAHFNAEQTEIWNEVLLAAPSGLLRATDRELLSAWCVACSIHRNATTKLNASPLLLRSARGDVLSSPLIRIINQQVVSMKALASELGFSPAARTRIAVEEAYEEDPTDRYFN